MSGPRLYATAYNDRSYDIWLGATLLLFSLPMADTLYIPVGGCYRIIGLNANDFVVSYSKMLDCILELESYGFNAHDI